jgi:TPR repeat protein
MKKILFLGLVLSMLYADKNIQELSKNCNQGKILECLELNKILNPKDIADYIKNCNKLNISSMCYQTGAKYFFGVDNVELNYIKAVKYYRKACDGGFVGGCFMLALQYLSGSGIKENKLQASKYFDIGCKKGHLESCLSLGTMYEEGNGVKKNYSKAKNLYRKACNNGHDDACFNLALMYFKGKGSKRQPDTAMIYLKRLGNKNHTAAQRLIGYMYSKGIGVEKSYIKAYAWLNLAVSNGLQDAQIDVLELESIMTRKQIRIAKKFNPISKSSSEIPNESKKTIKKIQSNIPKVYTGTGFFINFSNIVTNHHVVEKCSSINIVRGEYQSSAMIIVDDIRNDLAVLKTDKKNSKYLKFRSGKNIRIGEEIIVLGYPLGKLLGSGIKLTTGDVSSLTGLVNDATMMQITAPVQPGNSGGPLLDTSGNIVGVIRSRLEKTLSGRSTQNVNLAIKSNILQILLDTRNIAYNVDISKENKKAADIADESKDSIVQVICHE